MRKFSLSAAAVALTMTTMYAQAPSGPAAEVQAAYKRVSANIVKAADKMPADQFSYRPHAEQRTFARVVNHVIEAQNASCGMVNGKKMADVPKAPAETAGKDTIVAALKQSNAECEKAYASITDANLTDPIVNPRGSRSRIGVLWGNVSHDNEQYAILSDYLRDKNVAPPTSEK